MDEQGVIHLANEAARRAFGPRRPVGRRYVELVRHPDIGRDHRALRASRPTPELTIAQEPAQRSWRRRRASRARARRAWCSCSTHHPAASRRPHPSRFRRHVSHELRTAAHRHPGYVMRCSTSFRPTPSHAAPRHHRPPLEPHGGLVKDLLRLTRLGPARSARSRGLRFGPSSTACARSRAAARAPPPGGTTDIAPDAASLVGDPAKLHDVLRNLIETPQLRPRGTTIARSAQRDGDLSRGSWRQGPHPRSRSRARLRALLSRDKARSRETGGTGLGLSIVSTCRPPRRDVTSRTGRPAGGGSREDSDRTWLLCAVARSLGRAFRGHPCRRPVAADVVPVRHVSRQRRRLRESSGGSPGSARQRRADTGLRAFCLAACSRLHHAPSYS